MPYLVRTSKAAIIFALSVFSGLMTRKNTGLKITPNFDDVRTSKYSNTMGYNQSQAFDFLVDQCVDLSKSTNAQNRRANLFKAIVPANAKAIVPASAQIQTANNANNAKAIEEELKTLLSKVTNQNLALEAVWFAVCAVYAVLHHLIQKVYVLSDLARKFIVNFVYRLFVRLSTAVTRALAPTNGAARNAVNAPRLRNNDLTQGSASIPNTLTVDKLGRLVLEVLVVKRRLEVEVQIRQQSLLNGAALLEKIAKFARNNESREYANNVVELTWVAGRLSREVNYNKKTIKLAQTIVEGATTLQEELESLAQPTDTVNISPELQDAVLQLLHRVGWSNAKRRVGQSNT